MLNHQDIAALRTSLLNADYTIDAVLERLGEAGQAGLHRNSSVPGEVALAGADDPQATLIRLNLLQGEVSVAQARAAVDLDALAASGIVQVTQDRVRASVDIRPYGSADDGASGWIVSDLNPGMNSVTTPTRPDYVLGVSPASTSLAQMTARTQVDSALDLGTGCGVQALHLARHAERVVGTDVNPRALELARLTAELNHVTVDLRNGGLYEPVAGEQFDLIVTNPPYVMSPPTSDADRLTYREGTFRGDGLVQAVVRHAPAHLTDGGMLQVLGNWAILRGQPWQDRLAGWAEISGCDLWVVERERLDIYDYIELWLTDAGLSGSPLWRQRYLEWLDYFNTLGIEAVGMGWLTLTKAGRETPDIEIESWPHAVEQPVGPVFAQRRAAVTASSLSDAELLESTLILDPAVSQETLGQPGADEPSHLIFRSATGLRRAVEASTVTGGVLGACDGELSIGDITFAISRILDADLDAVQAEALPVVRRALREGMLSR